MYHQTWACLVCASAHACNLSTIMVCIEHEKLASANPAHEARDFYGTKLQNILVAACYAVILQDAVPCRRRNSGESNRWNF